MEFVSNKFFHLPLENIYKYTKEHKESRVRDRNRPHAWIEEDSNSHRGFNHVCLDFLEAFFTSKKLLSVH